MPPADPRRQRPSRNRRCEAPVRVFPATPGAIPTRVLLPILHALTSHRRAPTRCQLAERSGVSRSTIDRLLAGTDRCVTFEIADALLVTLDAVELWDATPLAHHYAPPPSSTQLINPLTPAQEAARTRAITRRRHAYANEESPEPPPSRGAPRRCRSTIVNRAT